MPASGRPLPTRHGKLHDNLDVAIMPLQEESSTMGRWMCQVAAFMERAQALAIGLDLFTPALHVAGSPLFVMLAPSLVSADAGLLVAPQFTLLFGPGLALGPATTPSTSTGTRVPFGDAQIDPVGNVAWDAIMQLPTPHHVFTPLSEPSATVMLTSNVLPPCMDPHPT